MSPYAAGRRREQRRARRQALRRCYACSRAPYPVPPFLPAGEAKVPRGGREASHTVHRVVPEGRGGREW